MATRHAPAPLDTLLAVLPAMPRPILARLTARLIERLDEMDGDPDVEPNNDELDGTGGEDDFAPQCANWLAHPGCPVSDPGEDDDPAGGNVEDEGEGENGILQPLYGVDQTAPVNEVEAVREWTRAQHRGGWKN